MSRLLYYLLFGFLWTLTLLPLKVLHLLSDFLYFLAYYVVSYRREITETNLRNSFPEKSDEEIKRISKKTYRNLTDQVIESFYLLHMSKKEILKRFEYKNPELLNRYYESGRSVILLCGHFGTWEMMVSLPLVLKHKVLAVYQPQNFKDFDRIYHYVSRRFGLKPVPMKEIYREITESKSRNEITLTFLLGDQSPPPGRVKYWTDFLNQDTAAITGYDRIAQKMDQAVLYMDIYWKKRGYYEISFQEITDQPGKEKEFAITEDYFKALEKTIRRRPELWLWTHRRWKRKRDEPLG